MKKNNLSAWNVKEVQFPKNGKLDSKIKFIVRYGILAPSGHNSQPWKFVVKGNSLMIKPDFKRSRQVVDPDYRELFISVGAAAANIETAAKYFGLIYKKEYVIDELGNKTIIIFSFKEGKKQSQDKEIFKSIIKRLTDRGEHGNQTIPITELKKIVRKLESPTVNLEVITDKNSKNKLGQLVYKSARVWFKSKELVEELENWLRDDLEVSKDGLPTGVLNLYKVAVNLKYFLVKDSVEVTNKAVKDKEMAEKAAALIVVTSKKDGIGDWIKTGEIYELMLLELTRMGISVGYFNTVIELKTQRKYLAEMLGLKEKPQMMLRLGQVINKTRHSPRRPLEEVLTVEKAAK